METRCYRPGSTNGKPDVLSQCFSAMDDVPPPNTILPSGRVVGAVVWGIEDKVRQALARVEVHGGCPAGLLFVPEGVRA